MNLGAHYTDINFYSSHVSQMIVRTAAFSGPDVPQQICCFPFVHQTHTDESSDSPTLNHTPVSSSLISSQFIFQLCFLVRLLVPHGLCGLLVYSCSRSCVFSQFNLLVVLCFTSWWGIGTKKSMWMWHQTKDKQTSSNASNLCLLVRKHKACPQANQWLICVAISNTRLRLRCDLFARYWSLASMHLHVYVTDEHRKWGETDMQACLCLCLKYFLNLCMQADYMFYLMTEMRMLWKR